MSLSVLMKQALALQMDGMRHFSILRRPLHNVSRGVPPHTHSYLCVHKRCKRLLSLLFFQHTFMPLNVSDLLQAAVAFSAAAAHGSRKWHGGFCICAYPATWGFTTKLRYIRTHAFIAVIASCSWAGHSQRGAKPSWTLIIYLHCSCKSNSIHLPESHISPQACSSRYGAGFLADSVSEVLALTTAASEPAC